LTKYPFLLFTICSLSSFGQQLERVPEHTTDTVHVKGDHFIFINDHAYYVQNDSILYLPDSVELHIRKNNMKKTDAFYENIKGKMSKSKISSFIYDQIFKSENTSTPPDEELSGQRFNPYENESIKFINYNHLDFFGTNINDTTVQNESRWTKPLNRFHIHTKDWVVEKNILFSDGEKLALKLWSIVREFYVDKHISKTPEYT
jgi:hypothetical protein